MYLFPPEESMYAEIMLNVWLGFNIRSSFSQLLNISADMGKVVCLDHLEIAAVLEVELEFSLQFLTTIEAHVV